MHVKEKLLPSCWGVTFNQQDIQSIDRVCCARKLLEQPLANATGRAYTLHFFAAFSAFKCPAETDLLCLLWGRVLGGKSQVVWATERRDKQLWCRLTTRNNSLSISWANIYLIVGDTFQLGFHPYSFEPEIPEEELLDVDERKPSNGQRRWSSLWRQGRE